MPLRRQVPVCARIRRVATAGPPSQVQDGDVPDFPHDRLLSVRTALSLHPQRRRATPRLGGPDRARGARLAAVRRRRLPGRPAVALPTSIPIVRVTGPGAAARAAHTCPQFDVTATFQFRLPVSRPARFVSFGQPPRSCRRRHNDRRPRTLRLERIPHAVCRNYLRRLRHATALSLRLPPVVV